jgi:hypothetical protein
MRRIAIVCLSLFPVAGCAFDGSEGLPGDGEIAMADGVADQEDFDDEAAELEGATPPSDSRAAADEVELTEDSVDSAPPSAAVDDATVAGEGEAVGTAPPDTAAADRYVLPAADGACHTFDYLRAISDDFCRQATGGLFGALHRNYTHGCTGWWGNGARYVWFSCLWH